MIKKAFETLAILCHFQFYVKNNVFSQSLTDFGVEIEIWHDGDHQFTVSIYIIDSNIITDQGSILHFVKEEC